MELFLKEEHRQVREMARKFADEVVAPQARGDTSGKTANNALQQTDPGVTPLAGLARGRWVPHGVAQGARHPARC